MKKTKIICTSGPASSSKQVIEEMFQAGMNGVRVNTAYGNLAQYQSVIETVREIADIPIIIDVKGCTSNDQSYRFDYASFSRSEHPFGSFHVKMHTPRRLLHHGMTKLTLDNQDQSLIEK